MMKNKKQTRKLPPKKQLRGPEGGLLVPKTTNHESNECLSSSRRRSSSRRLQQKRPRRQKSQEKRSRFDTRKTSHSQKSQKSSPRLQNHHALCTGSVCNPRPHKDDSKSSQDKIGFERILDNFMGF